MQDLDENGETDFYFLLLDGGSDDWRPFICRDDKTTGSTIDPERFWRVERRYLHRGL
jgi:hypothetical protein